MTETATPSTQATDEERKYRLSWQATNQYSVDLTEKQLRRVAEDIDCEQGDELDLDEVYDALNSGDWRAQEALQELAQPITWVDFGDCEVHDLDLLPSPPERA